MGLRSCSGLHRLERLVERHEQKPLHQQQRHLFSQLRSARDFRSEPSVHRRRRFRDASAERPQDRVRDRGIVGVCGFRRQRRQLEDRRRLLIVEGHHRVHRLHNLRRRAHGFDRLAQNDQCERDRQAKRGAWQRIQPQHARRRCEQRERGSGGNRLLHADRRSDEHHHQQDRIARDAPCRRVYRKRQACRKPLHKQHRYQRDGFPIYHHGQHRRYRRCEIHRCRVSGLRHLCGFRAHVDDGRGLHRPRLLRERHGRRTVRRECDRFGRRAFRDGVLPLCGGGRAVRRKRGGFAQWSREPVRRFDVLPAPQGLAVRNRRARFRARGGLQGDFGDGALPR